MRVLVLGATGLLGRAIVREAKARRCVATAVARRGADVQVDISDPDALSALLARTEPQLVWNCAALTSIDACDSDPAAAWATNARPLGNLARWCRTAGARLVQVSTDHFYVGAGRHAHAEIAPVTLVNEYACTKLAAEALALTAPGALVLRTSLLGLRGWQQLTFAEWALDVVLYDKPADLFEDAYTSSIDVGTFARAAFDLLDRGAAGLYNLASRDVYSKAEFVRELACRLGRQLTAARPASVTALATRRADSLGLDVGRAETLLGYRLPAMAEVVAALAADYTERT